MNRLPLVFWLIVEFLLHVATHCAFGAEPEKKPFYQNGVLVAFVPADWSEERAKNEMGLGRGGWREGAIARPPVPVTLRTECHCTETGHCDCGKDCNCAKKYGPGFC